MISRASAACGIRASNIYLLDDPLETEASSGVPSWSSLLQHGDHDWSPLTEEQAATTIAMLYQTSGTSGMPKYAAVSHTYFMANGAYIQQDCEQKPYDIRRLVALPLFHAFAGPLVHVAAIRCGTPTYILGRFSVPAYLDAIRAYQITDIPVVPSMLVDLTSHTYNQPTILSSLREVVSAGAPLTTSVATRFKPLLPARARLIQVYGLTEVGWVASTPWTSSLASDGGNPGKGDDRSLTPLLQLPTSFSSLFSKLSSLLPAPSPSSYPPARPQSPSNPSLPLPVGRPLPTYTLLLIDPRSSTPITAPNTPGELLVHNPHPFLYYLPEHSPATATAFAADRPGRWLRTGDLATLSHDPGGTTDTYTILDRLKDVIKVAGGWQVAPAELEGVLLAHPRVADAAVVGVPGGSRGGEVPVAMVVLRTRAEAEEGAEGEADEGRPRAAVQDEGEEEEQKKELMRWVGERVARYKTLAGVRWVERIPRNAAGKVLRGVLREKVRKESEAGNGGFGSGIEKIV